MQKILFINILTALMLSLFSANFAHTTEYVQQTCKATPNVYNFVKLPKYYPSNNMRNIIGVPGQALGNKLIFEGLVYDKNCVPVPGAIVELWHKNYYGVYNDDITQKGLMDANFTGTGTATTNNWGQFSFYTIFPGTSHKNEMPYVDVRVRHPDFPILETRLFFEGFYNGKDKLLRGLSFEDRRLLVADRKPNIGYEMNFEILLIVDGLNKYKTN